MYSYKSKHFGEISFDPQKSEWISLNYCDNRINVLIFTDKYFKKNKYLAAFEIIEKYFIANEIGKKYLLENSNNSNLINYFKKYFDILPIGIVNKIFDVDYFSQIDIKNVIEKLLYPDITIYGKEKIESKMIADPYIKIISITTKMEKNTFSLDYRLSRVCL